MIETLWSYVTAPENRDFLSWLGGGIVVIATGLWTVIKFFAGKQSDTKSKPSKAPIPGQEMLADRGGSVAGRDINQNSGNVGTVNNGLSGWQLVALVAILAGAGLLAISQVGSRVSATNGGIAIDGDVNGGTVKIEQ